MLEGGDLRGAELARFAPVGGVIHHHQVVRGVTDTGQIEILKLVQEIIHLTK